MCTATRCTGMTMLKRACNDRTEQITNWVRGLSAPMHLGLNRGAFCAPYRIMGAVAPRLKILMTSGSKKGTQIYYFFSLKSPSKQTLSRFPSGAPMERDTRLQGICVTLKDLIKIPLIRRPQERNAHPCSQKLGPLCKKTPISEPCLTYILRVLQ